MSLTAQEIIQVIEKAKELGVTNLKVEGIEIQIPPQTISNNIPNQQGVVHGSGYMAPVQPTIQPEPTQEIPDQKPEDLMAIQDPWANLTEEEVLFWATPYGQELEDKKKEQQDREREQRSFEESKE